MNKVLDFIAKSRRGRYWLGKISNREDFDPVFDIMANRVENGLRRLARQGLAPDVVIDVGANVGTWTQSMLPIFRRASFLMIEAQPNLHDALRAVEALSNGRARPVFKMLGEKNDDRVPFFLNGTGSSRYEEMTSFPRERTVIPMTTLDAVMQDQGHASSGSTLLKLDVQGAELDVLGGARATLQRTDAILLEASLVQYNAGAPRVADIIDALDGLDFHLFDIVDLRRIGTVLAQTDLIFVPKEGFLDRQARSVIHSYGRAEPGAQ